MAASQLRPGSGTGNAPPALARWISGVSILALSVGLGLAEPEFATDKMSDAELREFRNRMRSELQRLLGTAPREETPEGTAYRSSTAPSPTRRANPDSPLSADSMKRVSRLRD